MNSFNTTDTAIFSMQTIFPWDFPPTQIEFLHSLLWIRVYKLVFVLKEMYAFYLSTKASHDSFYCRFDGFNGPNSHFWCMHHDKHIYPAGWCQANGIDLQPPPSRERKFQHSFFKQHNTYHYFKRQTVSRCMGCEVIRY